MIDVRPRWRLFAPLAIASIVALGVASSAPAYGASVHEAALTAAGVKENDLYGLSADISGDTLVVSAPNHHSSDGKVPGGLYVFQRPAGHPWADAVQVATLSGSDSATIAGGSISGDTIVAVAPDASVGKQSDRGEVYVFVKPADGWHDAHETTTLTAFDGAADDELGSLGAFMSGDTVVATAPNHTVGDRARQGAAYVWQKPAAGWTTGAPETAELTAADGVAQDRLGPVAIDGGVVTAASFQHAVDGHDKQGEGYVWLKRDTGWVSTTNEAKLILPDGVEGDQFGSSVAMSGDTIVANAPGRKVAGHPNQGAAYVFTKPARGWFKTQTPSAQLTASDGEEDDGLAGHVDIEGTSVIVGAPARSVPGSTAVGAAYVFQRQGAEWHDAHEAEELSAPNVQANADFGFAVALSAGELVATAPLEDVPDRGKLGVAHVFATPPSIALSAPADGAAFDVGSDVRALYSCTGAEGVAVATCDGTAADGAPIDTAVAGPHTFSVSARDGNGSVANRSVSYNVVAPVVVPPPPPPPAAVAPTITGLRQSARVWREGRGLARVAARHRSPVGTTFSLVLDQPARVRLRFQGARSIRHGVRSGSLVLAGHAGMNRIRFFGRLSRSRRLVPGSYTVVLDAVNPAGQRSAAQRLKFTIVR